MAFDYTDEWPINDSVEGIAASYVSHYLRILECLLEDLVEGVWDDMEWRANPAYFVEKLEEEEEEEEDEL